MKPYFTKKGKYADGRTRIMIRIEEDKKTKDVHLPKPEILLKILDRDRLHKISKENNNKKEIP